MPHFIWIGDESISSERTAKADNSSAQFLCSLCFLQFVDKLNNNYTISQVAN